VQLTRVRRSHGPIYISRLGKIIRFQAAEVPPKEWRRVNCMNLRADECTLAGGWRAVQPHLSLDDLL
jgi:hypothetical protein